jgi:hypothetical protein
MASLFPLRRGLMSGKTFLEEIYELPSRIPLVAHRAADLLEHLHAVRVAVKAGFRQRRRRGRKQPTVKPEVGLSKEIKSARGLAHSKTLRAVRPSSENAPASWTAAALRRFSTGRQAGTAENRQRKFLSPRPGLRPSCVRCPRFHRGLLSAATPRLPTDCQDNLPRSHLTPTTGGFILRNMNFAGSRRLVRA